MEHSHLLANAGTPLMWAGCFQLIVGNALLGVFETWLLSKRFDCIDQHPRTMIWANYASMAAGFVLIWAVTPIRAPVLADPLRYGMPLVVSMWIIAFIVTALVEWPFVAKTAGIKRDMKSLKVSFAVQTVSYIALLPLVIFVGSMSALTSLKPVGLTEVSTVPGWVYYVGTDDVSVKRTRLDGSATEDVVKLDQPIEDWRGWITVEPVKDGDTTNLMFRYYGKDEVLIKNIGTAKQSAPVERYFEDTGYAIIGNVTFGHGSTRQFIDEPSVYCGFWSRIGMKVGSANYELETPFLAVDWRCPVVLPDGKIVVQFGNAILLIDPETEQAVKLAEGRGGDVLIDP